MPDDEDECPHGLGSPAFCSVCKHGPSKDARVQGEPEKVMSRFTAGFEGHCRECNLPIMPGQTIAKLMPSERYVHGHCAP
jgi:hypothetical protein